MDTRGLGAESVETREDGFRGRCAAPGQGRGAIRLRGAALSPHRPLTISFWWKPLEDGRTDSGFGLMQLSGKQGFVGHFVRSGPWCDLDRPAAVLQVYYLSDIQNVNGIYDREVLDRGDLRAGIWHHTAVVFSGGTSITVYTDGRKVYEVRLTGRAFAESDRLTDLSVGSGGGLPIAVDEVAILDRPLTSDEVAEYVTALRQMREAHYPLHD